MERASAKLSGTTIDMVPVPEPVKVSVEPSKAVPATTAWPDHAGRTRTLVADKTWSTQPTKIELVWEYDTSSEKAAYSALPSSPATAAAIFAVNRHGRSTLIVRSPATSPVFSETRAVKALMPSKRRPA